MKVIVGLGNPGHTFHDTRHNLGFAVIDSLVQRHRVNVDQRLVSTDGGRPAAVYGDFELDGQVVRLLMPLTMMNESGDAMRVLDLPSRQDLLIVCDDVNLPLGRLRLRPEGSGGGHHGLTSCLEALGAETVPRLRIGVGTTPLPRDLEEFVLSRFTPQERPVIRDAVARAMAACEQWVRDGLEKAMSEYNAAQESA